ncbi:ABC transporter substrate-binding protein/permease [Neokomagataea anthophila]|uniref:ABC transporter permease subunit n=1 Tax=Neokomagataea anthophila TaxID=2826925 RepID=A0ABS5E7W0_9PROT|nr:ABC transporter substrate-binding protein/permease [Neokomagataea anthophila]MBR0559989.1 ABC transporter permease subunit [Neokomagataea anthophila]
MKRFLSLICACWVGVSVLVPASAQAASSNVPGALNATDLPWASDGEANVPYTFHDPAEESRITGFEYDLVAALGEHMGLKSRFVQNDWDGLIPGLSRGLYAMVVDGIEMTPEHKAAVLFSHPYYITSNRIVVRKEMKDPPLTVDALQGRTVGTIKETSAERILRRDGHVKIRSYVEETNAFADLKNGRLDAILLDEPIALYYGSISQDMQIVGEPIGHTSYGIAFRHGEEKLCGRVDAALADLTQDGTLHRILAKWNLWTPAMADYTGDHTQPDIAPTEWQRYRDAMDATTGRGWGALAKRYIGFLPLIGRAALMTLAVSALAMVLAVALGVSLALARHYGGWVLRTTAGLYVEIIRGTPLLIQVLFIFYGLPIFGIRLSPFVAGVLSLGLNYAAYEAENYRAGLLSVPKGQSEAAVALNMTQLQALRLVVVPQAFRTVVPVMTNDFISLLKDSSLVSVITLSELSQAYVRLSATYYDYFGTGLMVGAAYLLLGLPFVRLARMAERRMGRSMGGAGRPH